MIQNVCARGLMALALAVLAAPSFAGDAAGFFDGSRGAALAAPKIDLTAARAASVAPKNIFKRSTADLYYFTPAEAALSVRRFGIRKANELVQQGFTFDPDVPAEIQSQMRDDLALIGGIQGGPGSGLHQQIFGAVDGAAYAKFFDSRVTAVGMSDCGSSKAVACVIPFQDPSKMWLTQNYVKFNHPAIARLMIVFHESRHTESDNGNWGHATCPTPFQDANGNDIKSIWTGATLAGEAACDVTPLGSYGSSTIMLKNISKSCSNCTDKVKMDAGLYADDQMNRIIDADARRQMEEDFSK